MRLTLSLVPVATGANFKFKRGSLLCTRLRTVDYSEVAKHQTELNLLQLWEELTFLEKVWLTISYPFRGRS